MFQTFKQYMTQLDEDAASKVAELDAMAAAIDTQIARLTKPLNDKKVLLMRQKTALLPQVEKERAEQEKNANGTMSPTSGSQLSTPGSAGAQTPGQPG